jgi:hypothetical protein
MRRLEDKARGREENEEDGEKRGGREDGKRMMNKARRWERE